MRWERERQKSYLPVDVERRWKRFSDKTCECESVHSVQSKNLINLQLISGFEFHFCIQSFLWKVLSCELNVQIDSIVHLVPVDIYLVQFLDRQLWLIHHFHLRKVTFLSHRYVHDFHRRSPRHHQSRIQIRRCRTPANRMNVRRERAASFTLHGNEGGNSSSRILQWTNPQCVIDAKRIIYVFAYFSSFWYW